jgi:NTP pyrophosphatase (non-canonical NTP hydrolase)
MISPALMQALLDFRDERDWKQFHSFRTLATSIVLEAAELAEISQWTRDEDLPAMIRERRERIEHEVADITILLSYLVHDLGIDLEQAVATKLDVNARKYPVAKSRGSIRKYNELD